MNDKEFNQILNECGTHDKKRISKPINEKGEFGVADEGADARKGKERPPAKRVGRGSPGAKHDFASIGLTNNKPISSQRSDYEAKYSKTGSILEEKLYSKILGEKLNETLLPDEAIKYIAQAANILSRVADILVEDEDEYLDQLMDVRQMVDTLRDWEENMKYGG